MKKSDIYEIAVKILGIYFLVTIVQLLVGSIASVFAMILQNSPMSSILLYGGVGIFVFIIMILIDLFFIFKTNVIVRMICKSTDFEQEIQFTTSRKVVYEIALVLMGMIIIVWALPDFVYKIWNYVQTLQISVEDKSFLIASGIKIVVGLIAVVYSASIASFLVKETNVGKTNEFGFGTIAKIYMFGLTIILQSPLKSPLMLSLKLKYNIDINDEKELKTNLKRLLEKYNDI